jgi:hypothetical protein
MMTGYSIAFAPYLPVWILVLLAAVAVILFGWLLVRRMPGTLFRAGLAALLLLGLANPALMQERRERNPDIALLIVDETPSQSAVGRLEETRAAAEDVAEKLAKFAPGLEVRRVVLQHNNVQDGAKGTRVVDATREALADVPARRYAGAILITEGQIHDPEELTSLPPGPLHALIDGARNTPDRRLQIVKAPSFGVVDEPLDLTLRISDPTVAPGETIRPSLMIDGVEQRIERLPFNQDVTVKLSLDHRGASIIELKVPELPGELSVVNNSAVLSVNGVRDRLRVLLVSGEPHPGERTWRNLLKSDPSVDLVHFTILRPPEKQDGTPIDELSLIAFPTRELFEVKLNDFDLIVFDSYRRRGVLPSLYLGNIVEYVRKGGALLDAAGPGFAGPFSLYRTPLGDILPLEPLGGISEQAFLPEVTERGLRHPVTAGLPNGPDRSATATGPGWGEWLRQIDVSQRSGDVVMTGIGGQPLIALDRVGKGRVAQISSDQIWLWARGYEGGGPHAELLRRLAHWLMKEPELEEEDLKAIATENQLEIRMRTLEYLSEQPVAQVVRPDGTTVDVPLKQVAEGLYAQVTPLTQSGLFEISEGGRTVRTAAGALNSLEFSDLVATDAILKQPVADTGGRLHWLADGPVPEIRRVEKGRPTGGSGWIGLVENRDYTVVGLDSAPMIPGWLLFLAAAGLLAMTWYREAR